MRDTTELPSQESLKELLSYYPETGIVYWRSSGKGKKPDGPAGCLRSDGYRVIAINKKQYLIHRVIWKWMTGKEPAQMIDHKDGNPSNNQWDNLRQALQCQNTHNALQKSNNTSGIKGVCWDKSRSKWFAKIRTPGKIHNLGRFDSLKDAEEKVRYFRERVHGEFANHGS